MNQRIIEEHFEGKIMDTQNKCLEASRKMELLEEARERYIEALPLSQIVPMMEASKLFAYADASETTFCTNMAELYGCVPLEENGNNLNDFLVTLYHYGMVQGIRRERARRKR